MNEYKVYTDGAYSSSDNAGGIGFVILKEDEVVMKANKKFINTTNQRMEMLAAIYAIRSIDKKSKIEIISDSAYVVNTMMKGWRRKANNDLWDQLDFEVGRHDVVFTHVRGHEGNKYNEIADDLAVEARLK